MPRMKAARLTELEEFWRAHLDGWRRSALNQREYCEEHGLPLKRFGNWRAKFRYEDPPKTKLLYRRGGASGHMTSPMTNETASASASYILSARSGERRRFSEADKKRIVGEAGRPGATVSGVARRYGIAARVLFRWKQELTPLDQTGPVILPVVLKDAPDQTAGAVVPNPAPAPVIVERSVPGIEVELIGGRRVRFERDTDPETVRRLVALLEGVAT